MEWVYSDQWAAGFFDGEGCVALNKQRSITPQYDLRVTVTQKDNSPLFELQSVHGGLVRRSKTPSNCWVWKLFGLMAERFLLRIRPFSFVKAVQIDMALKFRTTIIGTGQRLPPGVTAIREEYYRLLQRLKRC